VRGNLSHRLIVDQSVISMTCKARHAHVRIHMVSHTGQEWHSTCPYEHIHIYIFNFQAYVFAHTHIEAVRYTPGLQRISKHITMLFIVGRIIVWRYDMCVLSWFMDQMLSNRQYVELAIGKS